MGSANDHTLVDLQGDGEELATGLLLQEIIIRLDATEVILPHRRTPLLETAGPWTEGDAVVADLALRPEVFEGLPHGRIRDRRGVGIMELEDINVRRRKPVERLLKRASNGRRREIGPAIRPADLGGEDHELSPIVERLAEESLPASVPVRGCDVEVVDASVVGFSQEVRRLLVGELPPATRGEGPEAEPDLGDLKLAFPQGTVVQHQGIPVRKGAGRI